MSHLTGRSRQLACQVSRFAALVSACMLALSAWVLYSGGQTPVSAAVTSNGALDFTPTSGTSSDQFKLTFANDVSSLACPGDSATDKFRVQGFVVPSGTTIADLTFSDVGPNVGQPLVGADGNPLTNGLTAITTGNVTQLPAFFTFQYNGPSDFAAGTWVVGLACTQGIGTGMLKTYWSTPITITTDAGGGPAQISWNAATTTTTTEASTTTSESTTTTTEGSTTTTSESTTTTSEATTTTSEGTTTTTDPAATTTTVSPFGSTTTSALAVVSGTDTYGGGSPTAASTVPTAGSLPVTGSSSLPLVLWAAALLAFGRMAVLLGRTPRVIREGPPA